MSAFRLIMTALQGVSELAALGMGENISAVRTIILFGFPVLIAVILIVFAAIGKKAGAIGGIVCSGTMLVIYLIQVFSVPSVMKLAGYKIGFFYYVFPILAVLSLIMSIFDLKKGTKMEYVGDDPRNRDPSNRSNINTINEHDYGYNRKNREQIKRQEGAIVCIKGEYKGAVLSAMDGVRIIIGRSAKDCNLVLANPAVSRVHCYITYYADRDIYGITDVSKFGVFDSQGKPIEKERVVYMGVGDEIHIGKSHNVFRLE